MYQFIAGHQVLMFAVVPITLLAFMVIIGWLSRIVNHSQPLKVIPKVTPDPHKDVIVLRNVIVNVRWPINN